MAPHWDLWGQPRCRGAELEASNLLLPSLPLHRPRAASFLELPQRGASLARSPAAFQAKAAELQMGEAAVKAELQVEAKAKAAPEEEVPAPSDKVPEAKKEAERHFVACKKKLPPGEPRACEMAGYEACEDKCTEHFSRDQNCFDTCISHCVIGRNKLKELRVEPNCYAEKVEPGDLAFPGPKEPEVFDEIYREQDYQW
ncbi:unnamed protein product [Effrenium voratum]|nr:unnamed protein product [Effrenium voratum]